MAKPTNPTNPRLLTVVGALALAACALAMAAHKPAQAAPQGASGKIVFGSDRAGNSEIYEMNPDGSGVQRLTVNTPSGNIRDPDDDPAWSPDRTKIAFARWNYNPNDTNGYFGDYQVFVMDADGGNVTQLTDNYGGAYSPTWSPDGSRIAYRKIIHIRDNDWGGPIFGSQIYIMDADGSDDAPLRADTSVTRATPTEVSPDWSPDGSRIAFERYKSRGANAGIDIFTIKADGSGLTRLTGSQVSGGDPDWSPDGSRVLFTGSLAAEQQQDIWVKDADGGGKKRLTDTPALESSPAWLPDGTRIAFEKSQRGGDSEIWKMRADGSSKTRLTSNEVRDYSPDW